LNNEKAEIIWQCLPFKVGVVLHYELLKKNEKDVTGKRKLKGHCSVNL